MSARPREVDPPSHTRDGATHPYAPSSQFLLGALQIYIAPWVWAWLVAGSSRTARYVVLGVGVGLAALALWPFSVGADVAGRALVTTGMGICALAFDHRETNPSPSLLASLPTAQLTAIASFVMVMDSFPREFPPLWTICSSPYALETTQWMIGTAMVAYEAGRWFASQTGLAARVARTGRAALEDLASDDFVLVAVSFVGATVFLLIVALRGVGYLASLLPAEIAGFLGNIEFLYYVGLYASVSAALRRRWNVGAVAVWAALAFGYELLSGSKGRFALYVIVPFAMVYTLGRPRVPAQFIAAMVALGLVSWLVVYPTLVEYRNRMELEGMSDDPVAALATAQAHSSDAYEDKILIPIFQSQLAEQALAVLSVVHFDVRRPSEILPQRLFFFWIPRVLWPEKPMMLDVNSIGRESQRLAPSNMTTAVLLTSVGEQYVYLGAWGALATILTGLGLGALVPTARVRPEATDLEIGLVVYLFRLVPGLISGAFEADLTGFGMQSLAFVGFIVAVRALRPRPQPASA